VLLTCAGPRPRPAGGRRPAPDGCLLELPYDTLVIAAGATHSHSGRDHLTEYAPGMKTIAEARYLRDRILATFEMAEILTDSTEAPTR
jgi:NADH dehydrogenase